MQGTLSVSKWKKAQYALLSYSILCPSETDNNASFIEFSLPFDSHAIRYFLRTSLLRFRNPVPFYKIRE